MVKPQLSSREAKIQSAYSTLTAACFFLAFTQALSIGCSLAFTIKGNFKSFEPAQVLSFIPTHLILWRGNCLTLMLGSLVMLFFVLAYTQILERKLQVWYLFALLLTAISTASALGGQMSLLVMFSDLSQELFTYRSQTETGLLHLAWSTMSQCFSQIFLISNSLHALAGIILSLCSFISRDIPRSVGWTGLIAWLAISAVSVLAVTGKIDLTIMAWFYAKVVLVIYGFFLAIVFERKATARLRLIAAENVASSSSLHSTEST